MLDKTPLIMSIAQTNNEIQNSRAFGTPLSDMHPSELAMSFKSIEPISSWQKNWTFPEGADKLSCFRENIGVNIFKDIEGEESCLVQIGDELFKPSAIIAKKFVDSVLELFDMSPCNSQDTPELQYFKSG